MIKKIQIELILFSLLLINIFFSNSLDIFVYNFFSKLNYGPNKIYLKEFFIKITELGNSFWYFSAILLVFIFLFLVKKMSFMFFKNAQDLKNFCVSSLIYFVLVGLVTQAIKHLVGRPRPNHSDFGQNYGFNFFSTDSAFHSFPSGHSSTIIAVVLVVGLLIPSLRLFFYFFGFLIAISRVIVGAHFITDVVSGAIIAIMLLKILEFYFEKKFPRLSFKLYRIKNISLLVRSFLVLSVVSVFITVGFSIDVFFSGLFYYGNSQFLIQSYDVVSILVRRIFLPILILYIFFLPIVGFLAPINQIFFGHKFRVKEIVFVWFSGITTLILIVNVLLKNFWGRTRPNDILQFGGEGVFTPWYKFGETCVSNCSFVSGDASVGFILLVFYFITKKNIFVFLSLCFGFLLGFVRIIAGGHFFSDIIFAYLVVTISVTFFYILYKKMYGK